MLNVPCLWLRVAKVWRHFHFTSFHHEKPTSKRCWTSVVWTCSPQWGIFEFVFVFQHVQTQPISQYRKLYDYVLRFVNVFIISLFLIAYPNHHCFGCSPDVTSESPNAYTNTSVCLIAYWLIIFRRCGSQYKDPITTRHPQQCGLNPHEYVQKCEIIIFIWLVVCSMTFIFPYLGNIIIPTDFPIFQRARLNHQPVMAEDSGVCPTLRHT